MSKFYCEEKRRKKTFYNINNQLVLFSIRFSFIERISMLYYSLILRKRKEIVDFYWIRSFSYCLNRSYINHKRLSENTNRWRLHSMYFYLSIHSYWHTHSLVFIHKRIKTDYYPVFNKKKDYCYWLINDFCSAFEISFKREKKKRKFQPECRKKSRKKHSCSQEEWVHTEMINLIFFWWIFLIGN